MALLIAASLGAGILLTKLLRDQQQREAATNTETEADRHVLEYEGMDIAGVGGSSSSGPGLDPNAQKGTCSACLEEIVLSVYPLLRQQEHARYASSFPSRHVQYGLNIACPFSHAYCLTCFETFIRGKLEDAQLGKQIFPVRCPDCTPTYNWFLSDDSIRDSIPPALFSEWSTQRFLDSIPKMYCPNPRCSEVIALPEEHCFIADSNCPMCKTSICVNCRTVSHPKLSCPLWQRSPLNPSLSNPADLSLRRLAKRKHWRRCSKCRIVVERTEGCSHMTCRCGFQFCHLCGSEWTYNGCTNMNPKACDGRTWRDDPTLHVPSRWKGVIKRTVQSIQSTPEKLSALGSKTKSKVTFKLKLRRSPIPSSPSANIEPLP